MFKVQLTPKTLSFLFLQASSSLLLRMHEEHLRYRSTDNAGHVCCFLKKNIKLSWRKEEVAA